jgi:pyruvate/2-oxoglutarate dehydrogenase complex dihydrolipoamide dehydrogenase (E3) component
MKDFDAIIIGTGSAGSSLTARFALFRRRAL